MNKKSKYSVTFLASNTLFKKLASVALVFLIVFSQTTFVFAQEVNSLSSAPDTVSLSETVVSDNQVINNDEQTIQSEPQGDEVKIENQEETPILNGDIKKSRLTTDDVDHATGAMTYKYPIKVPPGRNKMTPEIFLIYNSSSAVLDSVIGSGWSINIPSIERINKTGSQSLFSENYYSSSLSGELIALDSTNYAAKNEMGDFLKYKKLGNSWVVTDKNGTQYTFGADAQARQDDPSNTSNVFRWMLEEERDTNNNYISYEYYKDAGQIYPLKITYTGNGNIPGIFEINFTTSVRNGGPISYATGFSVKSNYVITEINTKINNVWAKKYNFTYTAADNGMGSLLDTIIESGQDNLNTITTLPAVNFDYKTSTANWTYDPTWSEAVPMQFLGGSPNKDFGVRTTDINGDGLPDFVCANDFDPASPFPCQTNNPKVFLNTGNGWTDVSSTWTMPNRVDSPLNKEYFIRSNYQNTGLQLIDVNGDNLADLVRAGSDGLHYVYLNNGSGWTYDPTWSEAVPMQFLFGAPNKDFGVRTTDINGDGLPDFVCANDFDPASPFPCQTNNPKVFLNTGNGWTDVSSTWTMPNRVDSPSNKEYFIRSNYQNTGLQLIDVNGDNLADLVRAGSDGLHYVYLNNGSGWTYDPTWSEAVPMQFLFGAPNKDFGVRTTDINGDGLPDFVCANDFDPASPFPCQTNNPKVFLNTGNGWTDVSSTWTMPNRVDSPSNKEYFIRSNYQNTGLQLIDVNGDNLADLVRAGSDGLHYVYLNNTTNSQVNYLTQVTYSEGGNTQINYKATPLFRDESNNLLNPSLPMVIDTVSQIINNDGLGNSETYNYSYQDGKYYFNNYLERKFAGFSSVSVIDGVGNLKETYFHQGNSTNTSMGEYNDSYAKIGKSYRVEQYDSGNNLYAVTINKWDEYNSGNNANFVKLARVTTLTYDGTSDHKDKAQEYTYDNTYGNLTQKIDWGEVVGSTDGSFTDTGSDKSIENILYVANVSNYIVGLPYDDTTVDQNSVKENETRTYYDGNPLGTVEIGNLTKVEKWITGDTYANTQKSYDGTYGVMVASTDPNNNLTSYVYDSSHLYPITVIDALSNHTEYAYDYASGKITQTINPNNFIYQTIYDGLSRVVEQKIPGTSAPYTPVTKTTYIYTDTQGAVSVHQMDYLNDSVIVDTYSYFDGLGRIIQKRKEAETPSSFNISDTVYNNRGLVKKESLPYSGTGLSKTSPTTNTTLYTTYTYDPINRISTSINAVGTTSYTYNSWKTSITDPRGKIKDLYNDARGNLVQVNEHNLGSTYVTTYTWNLNGKLLSITDALNNVRNFTYDGLGNKLTAEDLHASGDTTYGSWSYIYDNAGNMLQSTSPNNKIINYAYDDLNRIFTEDSAETTGTEIIYTYDSCTNGITKVCSVTMISGTNTFYTYNSNENIASETKTINNNIYITSDTYDRQGNILTITYPDNAQVKYTFNTAGLLNQIERKESGTSFTNIVSNFDYSPTDQPTTISYANGMITTNTYNVSHLYRLSNKTTTNGNSINLQNISYNSYDANENILQIVDASSTNASKIVNYTYDDLNRMISATATNIANNQNYYTYTVSYDAIGNIINKSDQGVYMYTGNQGSNYANPHAVTSIGSINYIYDKSGNLIKKVKATSDSPKISNKKENSNTDIAILGISSIPSYTWNYKNELVGTSGASTDSYVYDHNSNRVKAVVGGVVSYYPSKFYNISGTKKTKYIYAGNVLVATVETAGSTVTPYYIHTDHLGSTNVVSSSAGASVQLLDYYPYGAQRINSGSYNTRRQYIGQIYDTDTGLNYLNARYYDGNRGQFISQDSMFWQLPQELLLDPQQMNSYSYGRDNPITNSDPSGKFSVPTLASIKSFFSSLFGNSNINNQTQISQTATPTIMSNSTTSPNDYPGGNYLTSNKVNITFDPDANHKVNPDLSNYFDKIMEQGPTNGINSVNLSSTINHTSNPGVSLHEIVNGARAVDINYINGIHVSPQNPYSGTLQNIIKNTPGYRENYGPSLMDKVFTLSGIPVSKFDNVELTKQHTNHIHMSVNHN